MKRAAIGLRSKMLLGLLLAAGLLTLVGAEEPAKAAFSGQNGKTAFTSNRVTAANPTGDYEIFTMNPDGTSFAQLTFNTQGDYAPAWSADGKQIAFTRYQDGNSEIYKMKPKPEGRRNRPVNLSRSPTEDDQPKWSADGKQIAFATRWGVGSDLEIYKMNADGTGATHLTENQQTDSSPTWSPDGTKIAFASNRDGNSEIYTMDANGSNQLRGTKDSTDDNNPDWQPT